MQLRTNSLARIKNIASILVASFCIGLSSYVSGYPVIANYFPSMPRAARVLEDIKRTTPLDTAARQHAALTLLREAVGIFEGQEFQNFSALSHDGQVRWQEYLQAEGNVEAAIAKTFNPACHGDKCDRARYYNSTWGYEFDPAFRKELIERYFPATLQTAFLAAKAQAEAPRQPRTVTTTSYVAPEHRSLFAEVKAYVVSHVAIIFAYVFLLAVCAIWWAYAQRWRKSRQQLKAERTRIENKEKLQESIMRYHPDTLARAVLMPFGATAPERETAIDAFFDDNTSRVVADFIYAIHPRNPGPSNHVLATARITRPLATMSAQERELLRVAYQLKNAERLGSFTFCFANLAVAYGDGKGVVGQEHYPEYPLVIAHLSQKWKSIHDGIQEYLTKNGYSGVQGALNIVLEALSAASRANADDPLVQRLMNKITGQPSPVKQSKAAPLDGPLKEGLHLLLGQDEETGKPVFYEGEGSLITIAPPGSGKTRCHVLPNLLLWNGPAVVLDVKGEIYATTARWREQNVGPVYKFSPLDPHGSQGYNPLALVRDDAEHVWEDAGFLANMMIVPGGSKEPFWELRARSILQAAIADTCFGSTSTPTLSSVLDVMHGVNWNGFIERLKACVELDPMYRAGQSLEEMDAKLKDSILQTAQASLGAWEGMKVARAISRSDWTPLDLISGSNPTVYICVGTGEIESYLSVLRVLIAQHIRAITSAPLPERNTQSILFMLDELPRLRHMQPVEEALDTGRQYGLRLWMFAQNLGQMENAYPNAAGMIGSCARRMYMNPSSHDGTAQKISAEMGNRESVLDGQRVPIAAPEALAGPEYQDAIIVMGGSERPRRLRKYSVDMDASLKLKLRNK